MIEPTFGVDRTILVVLLDAYDEEADRRRQRQAGHAHRPAARPALAPYKAAMLPLMKKPELTEVARRALRADPAEKPIIVVDYDETGNIGKRYRRQDEIGTPFCFTIDYETLDDKCVTVRHRDSMEQERIAIADVRAFLQDAIK